MLRRQFDPHRSYRVVLYLRMSNDRQNPRSPEQQAQEIERRFRALGYDWNIVNTYRDDGISGRLASYRTRSTRARGR